MISNSVPGKISIYADCVEILNRSPRLDSPDPLDVAKCLLTNTKMTCEAILKGRLTQLDPIVGENACQIRALAALTGYMDPELQKEAAALKVQVQKCLKKLNHLNNLQGGSSQLSKGSLEQHFSQLDMCVSVSERMDYLLRSHLLTIGKYFTMNRNGEEKSGIDCQNIKQRLKTSLSVDFLAPLVHDAREKMSRQSILFIQAEAQKLGGVKPLEDRCIRVIHPRFYTLHSSCALYNLKTVMQRVCAMQLPILLREHGANHPLGFCFQSPAPGAAPVLIRKESLKPEQAVLVIEGYFPESMDPKAIEEALQRHGILDLALANVALTPQYSEDDNLSVLDEEAKEEIARYKELGIALGCQSSAPKVFSIAHIHAATAREEMVR